MAARKSAATRSIDGTVRTSLDRAAAIKIKRICLIGGWFSMRRYRFRFTDKPVARCERRRVYIYIYIHGRWLFPPLAVLSDAPQKPESVTRSMAKADGRGEEGGGWKDGERGVSARRLKNRASSGSTNRKISYRPNTTVNHRRVNVAHTFSDSYLCHVSFCPPRVATRFSSTNGLPWAPFDSINFADSVLPHGEKSLSSNTTG